MTAIMPRDLDKFVRKLGNLGKVAKLKGAGKINVLYDSTEDKVQVQVGVIGSGGTGGNAFMLNGKGGVR